MHTTWAELSAFQLLILAGDWRREASGARLPLVGLAAGITGGIEPGRQKKVTKVTVSTPKAIWEYSPSSIR
jgi:urease beta subunit